MFKDVFKVKKTSYHARMMKYIWNLDYYNFSHMCPYFWLSIFNHFIIVFVFIFKQVYRLVFVKFVRFMLEMLMSVHEHINDYFDEIEQQKLQKKAYYYIEHPEILGKFKYRYIDKFLDKINDTDLRWKVRDLYYESSRKIETEKEREIRLAKEAEAEKERLRLREEFMKMCEDQEKRNKLLQTEAYIDYVKKEHEKRKRAEEEAKRQRIIRNKQRITNILKIVKPILTWCAYLLGSFVVIVGLYYGYVFFDWLIGYFSNIKHTTYIKVGKMTALTIGSIAGIALALFILFHIISYLIKIDMSFVWLKKGANFVSKPFVWLYKKALKPAWCWTVSAIGLVIQMFKNQCPAIEWED